MLKPVGVFDWWGFGAGGADIRSECEWRSFKVNIAVIGWGSLIWCPGSLRIRTRWHRDGPRLPIEFARISEDGRLTLVIHEHEGCEEQTTYWALSEHDNLRQALDNLREREGCSATHIASMETNDEGGQDKVRGKIREWLKLKREVGAVVWTNLPTNWQVKRGHAFTCEDAVRYLEELERRRQEAADCLKRAREYIRNAPDQIQPEVRKRICTRTDWTDNKLAEALFEPN